MLSLLSMPASTTTLISTPSIAVSMYVGPAMAGLGCRTGTTQQTENNAFLRMLSATLDHADTDAAFGVAKRALSKRKKLLSISSK